MMTVSLRKFALTAHVTSSVGWFGAVAAFLALAIAGLTSRDSQVVRSAYLAMHVVTWFIIVPMSLAALLTGLIQSLGTTWGLFRHYWIVTKLLLTFLATVILLVHTQPIDKIAAVAALTTLSSGDLWELRLQLVGDASAALFVLFATTMLSVYKPWGLHPTESGSSTRLPPTKGARLLSVSDALGRRAWADTSYSRSLDSSCWLLYCTLRAAAFTATDIAGMLLGRRDLGD